jgi:hypothetical protein
MLVRQGSVFSRPQLLGAVWGRAAESRPRPTCPRIDECPAPRRYASGAGARLTPPGLRPSASLPTRVSIDKKQPDDQ